jgi:hypothetical protein
MSRLKSIAHALLALSLLGGVAEAQGIAWDDLSDAQKALLASEEAHWSEMDPARQERMALGARRWLEMSSAERRAAEERFVRWQSLPEERRDEVRQSYRTYLRLGNGERAGIRNAYDRFRRMPPERREALRRRFRDMTPSERQRFRERRLPGPTQPARPANRR